MLLKGDSPVPFQTIKLKQLQGLLDNNTQVVVVSLCSLEMLEEEDKKLSSSTTLSSWQKKENLNLKALITTYQ
jgi:hypothetical protein